MSLLSTRLVDRLLLAALLVVWLSVFIKYDSFAFLSSSRSDTGTNNGNDASSHRLRQSIREAYHRVVDSKKPSDSGTSGDSHRFRDSVRDAYHRVADKVIKPKTTAHYPAYSTQKPWNNPNPARPAANNYPPPPNSNNYNNYNNYPQHNTNSHSGGSGGMGGKIKSVVGGMAGGAIMGALAKKIMGGGSHGHFGGNGFGGSGFGGHSHNYNAGQYNGYNYRPDRYGSIQGQVCTNYLEYDGIVYGQFRCPVEGFDYTATACCGLPKEQYCCHPSETTYAGGYGNGPYGDARQKNKNSFIVAAFVPLLFILLICTGVMLFCCYKRRIYETVTRR